MFGSVQNVVSHLLPNRVNPQKPLKKASHNEKRTVSPYFQALFSDIKNTSQIPNSLLNLSEQDFNKVATVHLGLIPHSFRTPQRCLDAVKFHSVNLNAIPQDKITQEILLEAVKHDGNIIFRIPITNRTPEMYLSAVSNQPKVIEEMPKDLINNEIANVAVSKNPSLIKHVPTPILSSKTILLALQQDGKTIEYIDKTLLTPELCQIAFNQNPNIIELIDQEWITESMAKTIVSKDGSKIRYLPANKMSPEIIFLAIQQNGENIQYIDKQLLTSQLCQLAFKQNKASFWYIPKEFQNSQMLEEAIEFAPYMIHRAHSKLVTSSFLKRVILKNPSIITSVDPSLINHELALLALSLDGKLLSCLPKRFYSDTFYRVALQQTGFAFNNIPYNDQTKELALIAVKTTPQCLTYLHYGILDKDFFDTILEQNILTMNQLAEHGSLERLNELGFSVPTTPLLSKEKGSVEPEPMECHSTHANELPFLSKLNHSQLTRDRFANVISDNWIKKYDAIPLLDTQDSLMSKSAFFYHEALLDNLELQKTRLNIDGQPYDDLYEIKKSVSTMTNSDALSFSTDHQIEGLFLHNAIPFGGRTLKQGENYFKFWKEDESLSNFCIESRTVSYLKEKQSILGLRSEVPESIQIVRVPVSPELYQKVDGFKDKPKIITDPTTGLSYYLLYHYRASNNYSIFAHQSNPTAKNPFLQAEEGLLKGIHDVSRLAKKGILYTNTLPAFHDTESERRWVCLGRISNNTTPPGTFGAWNGSATDFPDYGYSGLRDFGDFSLLGLTTDYISRDPAQSRLIEHSWLRCQKESLYNSIDESILATILLYARLHQDHPEYHHTSEKANAQMAQFIEKVLNACLEGYLEHNIQTAAEMLQISKEDYYKWLQIVSLRLIYWTERQGLDRDCYTKDLFYKHHFNDDVYPSNSQNFSSHPQNLDPEKGLLNDMGECNLGLNNEVFPILNLLEGLALLNRRLEQAD